MTTLLGLITWMQARIAALRSGAQRGAAAVEYGLLVALIAVAIIAAVTLLGGKVKCTFNNTAASLSSTPGTTTVC